MAELTFGQAVRNAVEAERAAGDFYRMLAQKDLTDEVRAFFHDMAKQEDAHADSIEQMGKKVVGEGLAKEADMVVATVETAPDWTYADSISAQQALDIALQAERNAALYYDALADSCPGEAGDFFKQLARTEEEHIKKLEAMPKLG